MSAKSKLRACMLCYYVQSAQQFKKDGCPNCETYLEMRNNSERVLECTSGTFDGTLALIDPAASWVAKWQRIDRNVPGLYAVRIQGQLPEAVVEELEGMGVSVISRNEA